MWVDKYGPGNDNDTLVVQCDAQRSSTPATTCNVFVQTYDQRTDYCYDDVMVRIHNGVSHMTASLQIATNQRAGEGSAFPANQSPLSDHMIHAGVS